MKVGLFQLDVVWENKTANFNKVKSLAKKTKEEKLDLIVLPELFSTGYTMNCKGLAEDLSGETPSFLSALAKDYKTNVLGSFIEKTETKPMNSVVLFGRDGNPLLHYSKIHLPSLPGIIEENKHYSPGNETPVCELDGHKIGVTICFDIRFPELFRKLADKGAKCIFVVASWQSERIDHWDLLLRARAVDNQLYVAGVNRVGDSPMGHYSGHSVIVDPFARVVASAREDEETVLINEIDFALVDKIRKKFPFLKNKVF